MQDLMKGKRGLIMGVANDHSIAWGIAQALAAQGAELAFTYQGDALGKRVKPLAQSLGVDTVIPCDVEDLASVDSLFATLRETSHKLSPRHQFPLCPLPVLLAGRRNRREKLSRGDMRSSTGLRGLVESWPCSLRKT